MPIDSEHSEYTKIAGRAKRVRDAVAGQEAVHAAGQAYLPQLKEQKPDDYNSYKGRAGWYGATGRTHDGMVGMVFRRPPVLECPESFKELTADLNLANVPLDGMARQVLSEVMIAARVGMLVEFPAVEQQPTTQAEAQRANLRPYAVLYRADALVNWRLERIANKMQPVLLVLCEEVDVQNPTDPHEVKCVKQLRELTLEPGYYVQRLWQKGDAGKWVQVGPDIVPRRNGATLTSIPFFVFGPEENSLRTQQPPLLQLADVNFGHYLNTADLEHGAHFTGLPTPWIAGYRPGTGEKVALGSTEVMCFPDPQATAGFLEFTGTGLQALEKRCEAKEQQMAALGARMLAPEKAGVEAGQTLAMRHTGESSVLAGIANLVSDGLASMLEFMAEWAGIDGEITYKLNTDYLPTGLTGQELTALVAAWQSGAYSWATLFANLKAGEIVGQEVTEEDERERIDSEGPTLAMQAAQGAADGNGQSGTS